MAAKLQGLLRFWCLFNRLNASTWSGFWNKLRPQTRFCVDTATNGWTKGEKLSSTNHDQIVIDGYQMESLMDAVNRNRRLTRVLKNRLPGIQAARCPIFRLFHRCHFFGRCRQRAIVFFLVFPICSIHISSSNFSPSNLFLSESFRVKCFRLKLFRPNYFVQICSAPIFFIWICPSKIFVRIFFVPKFSAARPSVQFCVQLTLFGEFWQSLFYRDRIKRRNVT